MGSKPGGEIFMKLDGRPPVRVSTRTDSQSVSQSSALQTKMFLSHLTEKCGQNFREVEQKLVDRLAAGPPLSAGASRNTNGSLVHCKHVRLCEKTHKVSEGVRHTL